MTRDVLLNMAARVEPKSDAPAVAPQVLGKGDGAEALANASRGPGNERLSLDSRKDLVLRVRDFLARIVGEDLAHFEVPTLIPKVYVVAPGDKGEDVDVSLRNRSIVVNEDLLTENPARLDVVVSIGTATYYLRQVLVQRQKEIPENKRLGIVQEGHAQRVIVTLALARMTAIAMRHSEEKEYGGLKEFAREVIWTDMDKRHLARLLHETFAEIRNGDEFRLHAYHLVEKDLFDEQVRVGRYIALLELLSHGGDVEGSIKGLFREGAKAIKGLARFDESTMHALIDQLLKKEPTDGRVKTINYKEETGDGVTTRTLESITISVGPTDNELTDFVIRSVDVKSYLAARDVPEGTDGLVTLVPGLRGPRAQIDIIAEDCEALFAVLEPVPTVETMTTEKEMELALTAAEVFKANAKPGTAPSELPGLPIKELDRVRRGTVLRLHAQHLLEKHWIEQRTVIIPEKGEIEVYVPGQKMVLMLAKRDREEADPQDGGVVTIAEALEKHGQQ